MTFELIAMNYGGVFNLQTLLRALVSCQSKTLNLPVKPIEDWKTANSRVANCIIALARVNNTKRKQNSKKLKRKV